MLSSPSGVLLTTYDQLRVHRDLLLRVQWGYAVLDEGHKIRNPDSEITLVCKQVGPQGTDQWRHYMPFDANAIFHSM